MDRIRTPDVPMWVTLLALLIAIFGTILGLMSIINPSEVDVTTAFERSYGGRNIGVAIVLGIAVVARSRIVYIAGFVGGLFRDSSDFIAGLDSGDNRPVIVGAVFVVLGLVALGSLLRPNRLAAPPQTATH